MRPFAAAALLAVIPQPGAAQHPDHFAVHVGAPLYAEADPHFGGAVSWRRYFGRGWGLNAEYNFSAVVDHADHVWWVGAAKSFGRRDESVPYIVLGGGGAYWHTLHGGHGGARLMPGIGVGLTRWNESRTRFVAPEARLGINAHLTFSLALGFAL